MYFARFLKLIQSENLLDWLTIAAGFALHIIMQLIFWWWFIAVLVSPFLAMLIGKFFWSQDQDCYYIKEN